MKIRPGYMLRQVMDAYVVVGIGSEAYSPSQLISLNKAGAFLWRILQEGADRQALVDAMLEKYDADRQTVERDVDAFLGQLREKALIDE